MIHWVIKPIDSLNAKKQMKLRTTRFVEQQTKHEIEKYKSQTIAFANLWSNKQNTKPRIASYKLSLLLICQTTWNDTNLMFAELYQFMLRFSKQQHKFNTSQFIKQQTKLTWKENLKPLLPIHWIKKPHKTKNHETSKVKLKRKKRKKQRNLECSGNKNLPKSTKCIM